MKRSAFLIPALLCAVASHAQVLFSENFESYESGSVVTAQTVVQNGTTRLTQIVSGAANTAGTGNALRIFDGENASGAAAGVEYNIVPNAGAQVSTLHLTFDISWNGGSGTDALTFSVGNYSESGGTVAALGSNGSRMLAASFREGGSFRWSGASGLDGAFAGVGLSTHFELFVNDSNTSSITFAAPDATNYELAANSFVVFGPGGYNFSSTLSNLASVAGGEAGIGRIGFFSTTASEGPDFIIDNITASTITAIPEPSTVAALAGLVALGFVVVVRRRVQRATQR